MPDLLLGNILNLIEKITQRVCIYRETFQAKITQRVCIYIERHSKQKSKRIYIFLFKRSIFFHTKATKAFFTKKYIYITLPFLLEIYKKHIDYLGNILLKSIGDL